MKADDLRLHAFYVIDGQRYRYMGLTHDNEYAFYNRALEGIFFNDFDLHIADIRREFMVSPYTLSGKETDIEALNELNPNTVYTFDFQLPFPAREHVMDRDGNPVKR